MATEQEKGHTMLEGNTEKPGVEERYESACGASSLKVQAERGGPGDLLIAAGWSEQRTGMALLRLHSEFTGAAKPSRLTPAQIQALADTFKSADEAERTNRDRENGELERLHDLLSKLEPEDEQRVDLAEKLAELESLYERGYLPLPAVKVAGNHLARARAHAARWYANELILLALSLKSRPAVWAQLLPWAQAKGIPEDQVAQALFHWLDPVCSHCGGHGLHKAKDAPALSAKQCRACNGTGTKMIPEGGTRVLSFISTCTSQARESLGKRLRATRENQ